MMRLITARTLSRHARTLRQISALQIDDRLKRELRRTYLRTFCLKKYNSKTNVAKILDYNVKFFSYGKLSYLFSDIFLAEEYFFHTLKQRPFIVDCGSNIGMSVLYFKMLYPQSEILAFEPDYEAFAYLQKNIEQNGIESVYLHQKALSNMRGTIDFYYDPDKPGSLSMSTMKERMPKNKQSVEAVPLSLFIDREVDFLKMDIEGSEKDVIEELSKEGRLTYIKQMVIEYHHHIDTGEDVFSHVLGQLENAGFGYQIRSDLKPRFEPRQFQDIIIYAYQKTNTEPALADR